MSKGGAIRWSSEQLAEFEAKRGRRTGDALMPPLDVVERIGAEAAKHERANRTQTGPGEAFYALGRIAKGKMNKTEAAYAQRLEVLKHNGTIIDYRFHAIRVRLADNTFYEPDFLVMTADRELQVHETKGSFTTQAGQTKIKLCAEVLPWFRVMKCSKQKDGSWVIQEFNK